MSMSNIEDALIKLREWEIKNHIFSRAKKDIEQINGGNKMSMTLSELEDHGRVTEILSRLKKIELRVTYCQKKLVQLEQTLETLSDDQPKPNHKTSQHDG